ncbi:MAG: hypothetical protein U5K56_05085 [Halioglobus sp.]|nr:hypothetical protein [Halioglobus sp.]
MAEEKSSADNTDQKAEQLSFTVVKASGAPVHYRLTKAESGDDFLLELSSHQHQFRLTQWQGKNLINAARRKSCLLPTRVMRLPERLVPGISMAKKSMPSIRRVANPVQRQWPPVNQPVQNRCCRQ